MKLRLTQIHNLIEERYVERGRAYLASGLVELKDITPTKVTARCAGTRMYTVTLILKNSRLSGDCTCPAFDDFGPCKHMAATALAVLKRSSEGYTPSPALMARKTEADRLEKALRRKTKAELVTLIVNLADDVPSLLSDIDDAID